MSPTDVEIAWLAGLLEGEGYFVAQQTRTGRPNLRVQLRMGDRDVVERAGSLMGCKVHGYEDNRSDQFNTIYVCVACGAKAERVMRAIRPYMGERRRAKIDSILSEPVGTFSHQPHPARKPGPKKESAPS